MAKTAGQRTEYVTPFVPYGRIIPASTLGESWLVPRETLEIARGDACNHLKSSGFLPELSDADRVLPIGDSGSYLLFGIDGGRILNALGEEIARLTELPAIRYDIHSATDADSHRVALLEAKHVGPYPQSRLSVWDSHGRLLYRDAEFIVRRLVQILFFDGGRQIIAWEQVGADTSPGVRLIDIESGHSTPIGQSVMAGFPATNPARTKLLVCEHAGSHESGRFQIVEPMSSRAVKILADERVPWMLLGGAVSPRGTMVALRARREDRATEVVILDGRLGTELARTAPEPASVRYLTFTAEDLIVSGMNGTPVNKGRNLVFGDQAFAYDLSGLEARSQ